jgi:hypothetical protein
MINYCLLTLYQIHFHSNFLWIDIMHNLVNITKFGFAAKV